MSSSECSYRCACLEPYMELALPDIIYPKYDKFDETAERLSQTSFAQPAVFTIDYAIVRQWMRWGIQPMGMIGHSLGEFTAACIAGVFSLEDGLRLVATRGRLRQQAGG